jgi:biopolymer transport protein ExbB
MLTNLLQDVAGYIEAGGWVMPPLIAATLILWFAIGYRFAALTRGSERDVRSLVRRFDEKGKVPKGPGVLVRAVNKGLQLRDRELDDLRRYLDDAFFEEQKDIRRYNRLIATIVSAAPLLGLLGTVIGMIETFDSLGDMSLFSQSGGIAGGISQALITTQMGLAVAIPGLIVNGVLSRRQKNIEIELAQLKEILVAGYKYSNAA